MVRSDFSQYLRREFISADRDPDETFTFTRPTETIQGFPGGGTYEMPGLAPVLNRLFSPMGEGILADDIKTLRQLQDWTRERFPSWYSNGGDRGTGKHKITLWWAEFLLWWDEYGY